MASVFPCVFFFISHLVLLYSAEGEGIYPPGCPPFVCGKVGKIGFPFANDTSPECGLLILHDCGDPHQMKTPKIKLEKNGTLLYDVKTVFQANTIQIKDPQLQSVLDSNRCESLKNWTLPSLSSPFISFQRVPLNLTLFKCNRALNIPPPTGFNRTHCSNYDIYYSPPHYNLTLSPPKCPIIQLPLNWKNKSNDLFRLLSAEISLEVRVTEDCRQCYIEGGQCKADNKGKYYCTKGTKGMGIGIMQIYLDVHDIHSWKKHISFFINFRLVVVIPNTCTAISAQISFKFELWDGNNYVQ